LRHELHKHHHNKGVDVSAAASTCSTPATSKHGHVEKRNVLSVVFEVGGAIQAMAPWDIHKCFKQLIYFCLIMLAAKEILRMSN